MASGTYAFDWTYAAKNNNKIVTPIIKYKNKVFYRVGVAGHPILAIVGGWLGLGMGRLGGFWPFQPLDPSPSGFGNPYPLLGLKPPNPPSFG